jgi:hypothetical protein
MNFDKILTKSMPYASYKKLLSDLMLQNKTTGPDQSESMVEYARVNLHRIKRLEKTIKLDSELENKLKEIKSTQHVVAITEGWCGDAAQNLPLFDLISQKNDHIKLYTVLRDENPEIMEQYLTNGAKAIPKVIWFNSSLEEKFTWGPRPAAAQDLINACKLQGKSKEEWSIDLHTWYSKDLTQSTQKELLSLISTNLV